MPKLTNVELDAMKWAFDHCRAHQLKDGGSTHQILNKILKKFGIEEENDNTKDPGDPTKSTALSQLNQRLDKIEQMLRRLKA